MPIVSAEMASARPPRIFWPLLGLIIILPVYGITILFFGGVTNSLKLFTLVPSIITLLVGVPAWWIFVVKPGETTVRRGMIVGVLSSITAHPVMWATYLILIWMQSPSTLDMVIVTQAFLWVIGLTALSLIFVGWLTALYGWFMGFCLIYFQCALIRASQWRTLRTTRKAEIIQWHTRWAVLNRFKKRELLRSMQLRMCLARKAMHS